MRGGGGTFSCISVVSVKGPIFRHRVKFAVELVGPSGLLFFSVFRMVSVDTEYMCSVQKASTHLVFTHEVVRFDAPFSLLQTLKNNA